MEQGWSRALETSCFARCLPSNSQNVRSSNDWGRGGVAEGHSGRQGDRGHKCFSILTVTDTFTSISWHHHWYPSSWNSDPQPFWAASDIGRQPVLLLGVKSLLRTQHFHLFRTVFYPQSHLIFTMGPKGRCHCPLLDR